MVDLIEIAKPLTRLKSIRQNQEPAGVLWLARGKLVSNRARRISRAKCLGFLKCCKNQAERRRAIDFLLFVGMVGTSGRAWHTSFLSLRRTRLHQSPRGGEIAHAAANNKQMVPIVAREVDTDTVPEALRKSGTNQRWLNGCVLMRFSPSQGSAQVLC